MSNHHPKLQPKDIEREFPNLGKPLQPGRSSANFELPHYPAFMSRRLNWPPDDREDD
jgi:hypothetical protein